MAESTRVNTNGGTRQFRHVGIAERRTLADAEIARRVRSDADLDAVPEQGEESCFFRDELDRWHQLDLTAQFKKFNYRVNHLCSTLVQLLHHRDAVVDLLLAALRQPESTSWKAYLALLAVLARDLRDELFPRYADIASAMRSQVDPLAPEKTAEVFRTLSLLFKHIGDPLLGDPSYGRHFNDWAAYLQHRKLFLRNLAAGSLAFLLRRASPGGQRSQLLTILKGVAPAQGPANASLHAALLRAASPPAVHEVVDEACVALSRARGIDLKDGVGRLLFETVRGPAGSFQQKAPTLLELYLGAVCPTQAKLLELVEVAQGSGAPPAAAAGSGKKRSRAVEGQAATLDVVLAPPSVVLTRLQGLARLQMVASAVRADSIAHTLRLCADHCAGGGSEGLVNADAACIPWHTLLDGLEAGMAAWVGTDLAIKAAQAESGSAEGGETGIAPSSKRRAGSGKDAPPPPEPSLRVHALHLHLTSLSLYLGQLSAMLAAWCAHKRGACIPQDVSRLSALLRRLTDDSVWRSQHAAGVYRLLVLKLLVASWPFIILQRRTPVAPVKARRNPFAKGRKGKRGIASKPNARGAGRALAGGKDDSDMDEEDEESSSEESADEEGDDDGASSQGDEDMAEIEEEGGGVGHLAHVRSVGASSDAAGDRLRLGDRLLRAVFSLPHAQKQPDSVVDKIAETITAASGGLLLPVHTVEGLQFPDVSRAGRSPFFRLAHVGSLQPQALILSFARELLTLATRQQAMDEEAGEDSGRAEAVLSSLLPPLLSYLQPLVPSSSKLSSAEDSTRDGALPARGESELVVLSTLLCARDAILPRGSSRHVPHLTTGIAGFVTAAGRLGLGGSIQSWLLSRLAAAPSALSLALSDPACMEDGGDAQRGASDRLLALYALVTAAAAVDLPAKDAVPALLRVFSAAAFAALASTGPSPVSVGGLPLVAATAGHIAASALLNAVRLTEEARSLHSRVTPDRHGDEDMSVGVESASGGDGDAGSVHVHALLPPYAGAVMAAVLRAKQVADDVRADQARLAAPDADVTARTDALLLALLNAAASFVEAAAPARAGSPGGASGGKAAKKREGGKGKEMNGIFSPATTRLVLQCLSTIVSGSDHSLRLSALRLLAALPGEAFTGVGVLVATQTQATTADSVKALLDGREVVGVPELNLPSTTLPVLLDDRLVSEGDSALAGLSPVPDILLSIEALPNAMSQERTKITMLTRVGVLLGTRRLPPVHVILAIHACLGQLHVKFAPLWPAATKVLAIAAETYPRTTWAIVGCELRAACIARAPPLDSGVKGASRDPSARVQGQSRSATRAEAAAFHVVPLRVTALAVAALTGRDPDAMSMAGTVVSVAESIAEHDGMGGAASGGADAAMPPGREELANRVQLVLARGLFGADAGTPAMVANLVQKLRESSSIAAIRDSHGGELVHANDAMPLGLGEGGATDTEMHHKTLLGVLQAASGWAEARSRALVPLFLAFMRDDWFGRTHAADPDASEVDLGRALQGLYDKQLAGADKRREREAVKTASKGGASVLPAAADASAGFEEYEKATEGLLVGIVAGRELQAAAQRAPLQTRSAAARLVSFLQLFEKWSGWDGIVGRRELAELSARLLIRQESEIAENALKVLLAMKLPGLMPYRDRLLRLCGDKTFREEITNTPLVLSAGVLASEHRPTVIPVILRLMYGRLMARNGSGARDSLAARRAAILAYVSTVSSGPETAFFIHLAMRSFLTAGAGGVQAGDAHSVLGGAGLDAAAPLLSIQPVSTTEQAEALLHRLHSALAPIEETSAAAISARRLVTAGRAVGSLNLLRDIIRQFANRALPHMHVLLGIILVCLAETRVRPGATVDDTVDEGEAVGGARDSRGGNRRARRGAARRANEEEEEDGDDGSDRGLDDEDADVEEEEGDGEAVNAVEGGRMEEEVGEGGDAADKPTTALVRRARDVRSLAILRLADIIRGFGGVSIPLLHPWLPTLRACLAHAIVLLPSSMVTARKPSGLLHLFATACVDPETLPLLRELPGAVPATLACLTTGYTGWVDVYSAHWTATVGAAPQDMPTVRESAEQAGPAQPVAAAAFTFLENLLTSVERAPASAMHTVRPHLPFILRHLCLRLRATVRSPQALDAALAGLARTDGPASEIVVPSLRGGLKAFARQQLVILGRLAAIITKLKAAAPAAQSEDVMDCSTAQTAVLLVQDGTVSQLVLLLLPYLRHVHRSSDRNATPAFGSSVTVSRTGIARDAGPDIPLLALQIISQLAPLLPTPAPFLPYFSALLAPGPRELSGQARTSLLALLKHLGGHPSLSHLAPYINMAVGMGAMSAKRVDELDYDTALTALADMSTLEAQAALLGDAAAALPAVVHQAVHLMHDGDMATRAAALNACTAFVKAAGRVAVGHWQTVEAPHRVAAIVSGSAKVPAAPEQVQVPHVMRIMQAQSKRADAASAHSTAHDAALFAVVSLLVPNIRASMGTASPGLRRGFIVLLSDVVNEWAPYGVVTLPAGIASAKLVAVGMEDEDMDATQPVSTLLHSPAAGGATPTVAPTVAARLSGHANLHADLAVLTNRSDPEADGWLNLTHVQIHRRARSLGRLATLISSGAISLPTVREFILPLTLHSLYDEAGSVGGYDVLTVESKGRRVRVGAAADKAGAASGLHAEAVRLIGCLGRVLPFHLYATTMRTLMRLASTAAEGVSMQSKKQMGGAAAASALEKVLVRAISALAESVPELPAGLPAAAPVGLAEEVVDRDLDELLLSAIMSKGQGMRGAPGTGTRKTAPTTPGGAAHGAATTTSGAAQPPPPTSAKLEDAMEEEDEAEEEEEGPERDAPPKRKPKQGKDGQGGDEDVADEQEEEAEAEDDAAADGKPDVAVQDEEEEAEEDAHLEAEVAADAEAARRSVLLNVASILIPGLRRLLRRADEASAKAAAKGKAAGAGKSGITSPYDFELRPGIAMALVSLCRVLPPRVADFTINRLLLDVVSAQRSRRFDARETARQTLAKMAIVLGPVRLPVIVGELRRQMTEGYQAHVRGHALFAVLEALAPQLKPEAPVLPSGDAPRAGGPAGAADDEEMEGGAGSAAPLPPPASPVPTPPKPGHAFLVACMGEIMTMVMDDAVGETAASRGAGVVTGEGKGKGGREGDTTAAGYKPAKDLALREAKSSRAADTVELLARCTPFLPNPAIHSLTAPFIAALENDRTSAGLATALGRAGVTSEIIEALFRRVLAGLGSNPSVTGPYVLLYAHGVCSEFLGMTALAAHKAISDDEKRAVEDRLDAEAAVMGAPSGGGGGGRSLAAYGAPLVLPSFSDAYGKFMRLLNKRRAGAAAAASRDLPGMTNTWIVHDAAAALGKAAGKGRGVGRGDGYTSGAMLQRGAGVTSTNVDVWRIAAEPKMTGNGRFVATDKRAVNSGSSSAADVPMANFALGLLHSSVQRGRITSTNSLHVDMLDPYVPLLLKIIEDAGHAKLTALALRLLCALLPYPLPMLRRVGGRLTRAILSNVEKSAGGSVSQRAALTARSELASAALKAGTVLIRACEWAKVNEEQLRALLAILRADLSIPTRQNATFGMLRAIVGRRLIVVEVYDLMNDLSKLLVTSLRPTARSAAAGVFLAFLLKYPLSDKALASHLDFFVRNLGYAQEAGRATVLDVLGAVVSRFPTPILDDHASFLLLPLTVRLATEPSTTCRAAVGAIILQLFTSVSHKTAVELLSLCLAWLSPHQKAGVRRSAAQVVGMAAEARPDMLSSTSFRPTLVRLLRGLTYEVTKAVRDVALIEERLVQAAETRRSRTGGRVEGDMEEEEEDGGGEEEDSTTLAQQGTDANEDKERSAGRRALLRATAILAGAGLGDGEAEEEDEEEGEDGKKPTQPSAPIFPVGSAGGGADVFVDPVLAVAGSGEQVVVGAARPLKRNPGVLMPLVWEPAYYALIAAEKLLKSASDAVDAALAEEEAARAGGSAPSEEEDQYAGAPPEWHAPVTQRSHSATNVVAAACNALQYPHAWVRSAAARVLGQFFSRRTPEQFAPGAGAGSVSSAGQGKKAKQLAAPAPAAPSPTAWLADDATLRRLCFRCVATIDVPGGPSTHLADQATKNLVFATLALHASVREGAYMAPMDRHVAEGHAVDTGATRQSGAGSGGVESAGLLNVSALAGGGSAGAVVDAAAAADTTTAAAAAEEAEQEREEEEEGEGGSPSEEKRDALLSVFVRATSTASRSSGDATKGCLLQWMAAVALRLPTADLLRCLVPCVRLLYRLTTVQLTEGECSGDTRGLANEAVELLQAQAGAQAFLQAFNAERVRVGARKLQRRKDAALLKVLDASAAARAKEKRQAAKSRQKKRKVAAFKAAKGKDASTRSKHAPTSYRDHEK